MEIYINDTTFPKLKINVAITMKSKDEKQCFSRKLKLVGPYLVKFDSVIQNENV